MKRCFILALAACCALAPLCAARAQSSDATAQDSGETEKAKQPQASTEGAATKDASQDATYKIDDVVVTATRSEMLKEEVPAVIDVINSQDIQNTVDDDLPDILKKNSSVDVIDYPGALSGVSIRGFRPEYDGITKHYLVLIDGRPAGATNLATILKDNIERIEVLKGPASSLYGAEAMGGVINVITKKSTGKIGGNIEVGGGSFDTHTESASAGGKITDWLDFDASVGNKNQNDNYKMGNGEERSHTSLAERNGSMRVGSSFLDTWRVDAKTDVYMGRDIGSPNALYYGDTRQSTKDIDRYGGDVALSKEWSNNLTKATVYASHEKSEYTYSYTGQPVYKGYEGTYDWLGAQLQDTYSFLNHDVTVGFDYQDINVETLKWNSSGKRQAPNSPDNERENVGVFADGFFRFWDDRIILNAGVRYDTFEITNKSTPLKTDFEPGSYDFDHVSPRAGIKFFPTVDHMFQFHATVGTAFVPPQASQMAGYAETQVKTATMITTGNPGLDPETSITWDGGVTFEKKNYGLRADLTYFETNVDDKITTVKLSQYATSYTNADSAKMNGLELEASWDLGEFMQWGRKVEFFLNSTRMMCAREELTSSGQTITRDIYNVAHWKHSMGVNYDDGMFFGRFLARYMGERKDNDFYTPGYPEITYDDFIVCDASLGVRFLKRHTISLNVENIFDEYYYEKPEYPLPGRAIYAKYSLSF
jgi:vitamin B12 transporter